MSMADAPSPIPASRCLVGLRYGDKRACLGDLAARAASLLGLERRDVLEALLRREALGSTGVGDGVALPHARLASLREPFVLLATLAAPVAFEAVDERPVDLLCLLLLPDEAAGLHLALLSRCARTLRDKAVTAAMRRAGSADALAAVGTPPR